MHTIKKWMLLILPFIWASSLNAQTVYELVVGGTKTLSFSASQYWEEGNWGDDPLQFGSGCGDAEHKWEVIRHRGYLTTTLKELAYKRNSNPDNSIKYIEIINNLIVPGSFTIDDNYYEQKYSAQRNKDCNLRCSCPTSQCCETDYGWSNTQLRNKYILNVETAPVFNTLYNFNETINQFTICSGEPSFLLSKLIDKTGGAFLDEWGDKYVPLVFDPSLKTPKNQKDTILFFTYGKAYANGGISKKFSIKVLKSTAITTENNLDQYSVCKNAPSFDIVSFVKANPLGGQYFYNSEAISTVYPREYSSPNVDIQYKVLFEGCESVKTINLVFKSSPVIKDITTIGTYCNTTKNIPLKFVENTFPYFSETYDLIGQKNGIVRGLGVNNFPLGTLAPLVAGDFIPNKYDTLDLSSLTEGTYPMYYDVKDFKTNCISTDTFTLIVKAPAIISANTNVKICNETIFYEMSKDVLPKGGVFKTDFTSYLANDSTLNISKIPLGNVTVNYSYRTPFGCVSSAVLVYEVLKRPIILIPADTSFCESSKEKNFVANPIGGLWSGQGITPEGLFTPSNLQAEQAYKLTYSYGIGNCSDSKNMFATILKRPESPEIIGAKSEYCTGDSLKVYGTVQNSSGLKFRWYINEETVPIRTNTYLNFVTDKNLKRILAETVNAKGCASLEKSEKRFIMNDIEVNTTVDKYKLEEGDYVNFSTELIGDDVIKSVLWDFGDRTNGIGENLAHYYYDSGTVAVKYKVLTDKGCEISKKIDSLIHIKDIPINIRTESNQPLESFLDNSENIIRLYPNPSESGMFTFSSYIPLNNVMFEVYSPFSGVSIYRSLMPVLRNADLDLSDFPAGMYLCVIKDLKGNKKEFKLIKN